MGGVWYDNNRLASRKIIINATESICEDYYDNEINAIKLQTFHINDKLIIGKRYYETGNIKDVMYFNDDDKLHKIDAPSLNLYYENGNIKLQVWYINGNIHRDNLPAVECFNRDGKNVYIAYFSNGKKHRDGDYAEWSFNNDEFYDQYYDEDEEDKEDITSEYNWYNNGIRYKTEKYKNENKYFTELFYENNIRLEEWCIQNKKAKMWYRENEPFRENDLPTIEYYSENNLIGRKWMYSNGCSRDNDLPAIEYYDDGNITEKVWYINGKIHRNEGFAVECYENNVLISGEIWKNGIRQIDFDNYIGNENCFICHESNNDMILTICRHIFCKSCIESWMLESNDDCPYCRQKM